MPVSLALVKVKIIPGRPIERLSQPMPDIGTSHDFRELEQIPGDMSCLGVQEPLALLRLGRLTSAAIRA